jgi:transposase
MAKWYSQDLRDRLIDAVERGKMSRRASGRHYEVGESVAIKWLERLNAMAPERLSDMAAIARPS